jgi:Ca2+-transporting ATPase
MGPLAATILVTTSGFLQRIFDTVVLSFEQWWICVGIASSPIIVEEVTRFVIRRRERVGHDALPAPVAV